VLELARPVIPGNLLGLPSAVVPIGLVDGLPVGAHVQANRFAEPACLAAAQAIEARVAPLTPIDPRPAADQATGAQLARG
jgi:amidase